MLAIIAITIEMCLKFLNIKLPPYIVVAKPGLIVGDSGSYIGYQPFIL